MRHVKTCETHRLKGWFFLPEAPTDRVPGILASSQRDGANLELIGGFSPKPEHEQLAEGVRRANGPPGGLRRAARRRTGSVVTVPSAALTAEAAGGTSRRGIRRRPGRYSVGAQSVRTSSNASWEVPLRSPVPLKKPGLRRYWMPMSTAPSRSTPIPRMNTMPMPPTSEPEP